MNIPVPLIFGLMLLGIFLLGSVKYIGKWDKPFLTRLVVLMGFVLMFSCGTVLVLENYYF